LTEAVPRRENAADKQRRLAHEAEMLAQARTSAAAGRTVSEEQVDAWVDSLGTAHELPAPRSGRTVRNDSVGDVLLLRVFGPGQSRERL
jgi:hypothetical protein